MTKFLQLTFFALCLAFGFIWSDIAFGQELSEGNYKILRRKASQACALIREDGVHCEPEALLSLLGEMYGGKDKIPLAAFERQNIIDGNILTEAPSTEASSNESSASEQSRSDSEYQSSASSEVSDSAESEASLSPLPVPTTDHVVGSTQLKPSFQDEYASPLPTSEESSAYETTVSPPREHEVTNENPIPTATPMCRSDMITCQQGTAYDCCNPETHTCIHKRIEVLGIGGDYAKCQPKSKANCSDPNKPKFCPNGGDQGGGTCCPDSANCGTSIGKLAFCSYASITEKCTSPNFTCHTSTGIWSSTDLCCAPHEECKTLKDPPGPTIVQACSAKLCKSDQTACTGRLGLTICSDDATTYCSPSTGGNPTCVQKSNTTEAIELVSSPD